MESKVSPQGVTLVPTVIGLMADTKADSNNHSTTEEKELRIDTSNSATEEIKSTYDQQENHTVENLMFQFHMGSELIENLVMEEVVHEEEHKKKQVLSNHVSFLLTKFLVMFQRYDLYLLGSHVLALFRGCISTCIYSTQVSSSLLPAKF